MGRRRVPAETPGRAFPSHALRPGYSRLRPGGDGSSVTTATPGRGFWGRAVEGPRVGRGRRPRGGGARRKRPARSFSGISHRFSINEPPTTAVLEPRSRPRTHSQFLNQHHLPGTPSQLLPLPPPPLPPLTAPAWPRLPDHRLTSAPARPHPSAETRRVSAREGLAPPQFRAPPWAHETSTAVARPAGGRAACTATAQSRREVAGLLP